MCNSKTGKRNLLCLMSVLIISGCMPRQYQTDIKKPGAEKEVVELFHKWDLLNLYSDLKPDDYQKEIARLESLMPRNTDSSFKAMVHLRLGLLHLYNNNPKHNYHNALKELELYLALDTKGDKKEEVKNLIQPLRELIKTLEENKKIKSTLDQLTQESVELKKENGDLKKENQEIKKENQEFKKTVEQLKSLDMNIEERRKQIK